MADDQRIRPTVQGRARLLQAVAAVPVSHVLDSGTLGEYAQVLADHGRASADREFPDVAAHLATGCEPCADDLRDLLELAQDDDHPSDAASLVQPPRMAGERPGRAPLPPGTHQSSTLDDSGIHVRDLPDPRRDEAQVAAEVERRRQMRKWREWLLIAAAAAVLLMGLSLVALAYLASGSREAPRLELAPAPNVQPGQPAPIMQPVPPSQPAPAGQPAAPTSAGFAPPNGANCPTTHPIKGNRNSGIYHLPGGGLYEATRPEQCFAQPSDAEAAGYRRSQR